MGCVVNVIYPKQKTKLVKMRWKIKMVEKINGTYLETRTYTTEVAKKPTHWAIALRSWADIFFLQWEVLLDIIRYRVELGIPDLSITQSLRRDSYWNEMVSQWDGLLMLRNRLWELPVANSESSWDKGEQDSHTSEWHTDQQADTTQSNRWNTWWQEGGYDSTRHWCRVVLFYFLTACL